MAAPFGSVKNDRSSRRAAEDTPTLDQVLDSVVCLTASGNGVAATEFSGFLVERRDGEEDDQDLVLTTSHALLEGSTYEVQFRNLGARPATLLKRDDSFDLAIFGVEAPAGVRPLALSARTSLPVGTEVSAPGCPLGQKWTASTGIVGSGPLAVPPHPRRLVRTDAQIDQGSSGGPLVDDVGEVVGIVKGILRPKNSLTGLNFAIPGYDVRTFYNGIRIEVEAGWMELHAEALSQELEARIRTLELCLERHPLATECRYELALAFEERKDRTGAEREYRTVLEHRPDHEDAQRNLTTILAQAKRLKEAWAICEDALTVNPWSPTMNYNCGLVAGGLGNLEQAGLLFEESCRQDADYLPGCLQVVSHHDLLGDCEKARRQVTAMAARSTEAGAQAEERLRKCRTLAGGEP